MTHIYLAARHTPVEICRAGTLASSAPRPTLTGPFVRAFGEALRSILAPLLLAAALANSGCSQPGPLDPRTDPIDAIEVSAGADQDVARNAEVSLSAADSELSGDGMATYTWRQIHGPDVTDGTGTLSGVSPSFRAPDVVSSVVFELTGAPASGSATSVDTVQINVLESLEGRAIFVDGDSGSDSEGDGSRGAPYATITGALDHVDGQDQDIYVMTRAGDAPYVESTDIVVPTSVSLYGGFDETWRRDVVDNRTPVQGTNEAIKLTDVDQDAWVSGFNISAASATTAGHSAFGVVAIRGSATLTFEDNGVMTGDGADAGAEDIDGGSSYGLFVSDIQRVRIRRNTITAGRGGAGLNGETSTLDPKRTVGGDGGDPDGGEGGKGGGRYDGGRGGDGGSSGSEGGDLGEDGEGPRGGAGRSGDGEGGDPGAGGEGGLPGLGSGSFADGFFVPSNGGAGSAGQDGGGGGGGGGGAAGGLGVNGGGGGGGGGGGAGGPGGGPGGGGGASIGLVIHSVPEAEIQDNVVRTAGGGNGGDGGPEGRGTEGTSGGNGRPGKCSPVLGCRIQSAEGAEGGGGGGGGAGGNGGGGAGGPSYGIVVGASISPAIRRNTVTTGTGGRGGAGGFGGCAGGFGQNGQDGGGAGGSSWGSTGVCPRAVAPSHPSGGGGFSYAVFEVDTADGMAPLLESNTLSPGEGGSGGAPVVRGHEDHLIGDAGADGASGEINR